MMHPCIILDDAGFANIEHGFSIFARYAIAFLV